MTTRAKDGIVQPRLHPTFLLTELEPTSYKISLKFFKCLDAMRAKHVTLINNNTWTITILPPNKR